MARKRGGYQRPSKPAAVSGPGALSARTDGGVPQTIAPGGDYGDRKALREQMQSAPLDSPQGGGGTPMQRPRTAATQGPGGVFSPSARPGEPMTAGTDFGPGQGRRQTMLPPDPHLALRALISMSAAEDVPRLSALLERLTRA